MAITDNFDNTLLQLLQAQQVANNSGNNQLAAVISNAISSASQIAGYAPLQSSGGAGAGAGAGGVGGAGNMSQGGQYVPSSPDAATGGGSGNVIMSAGGNGTDPRYNNPPTTTTGKNICRYSFGDPRFPGQSPVTWSTSKPCKLQITIFKYCYTATFDANGKEISNNANEAKTRATRVATIDITKYTRPVQRNNCVGLEFDYQRWASIFVPVNKVNNPPEQRPADNNFSWDDFDLMGNPISLSIGQFIDSAQQTKTFYGFVWRSPSAEITSDGIAVDSSFTVDPMPNFCLDCISVTGTSGTGGITGTSGTSITGGCSDNWTLPDKITEELLSKSIPEEYVRVNASTFDTVTSEVFTEKERVQVPGNPCYVGFKQTTRTVSEALYTYQHSRCNFTHTITVVRIEESSPTWVNQILDDTKPECKCKESYEPAGVLLDPEDPCGCKQYNLVKIKLQCPGKTELVDSTEVYRDGLPASLKLPPGHRLDPTNPFTVRADCKEDAVTVYHSLMLGKDIVEGKVTANTRGLFNMSQSMSCYHTSSLQSSSSKDYYYEVTDCDCYSTPYFAVSYGHVSGSGSISSPIELNDTTTRAIYSQYRLLALDEPERKFKFYSAGVESESPDIYVINFYRNGLSDRVDPGNFEVALRPLNGDSYGNNFFTGSNVQPSGSTIYTFIDNSMDRSDLTSCSEDPYVSYDIVSGSLITGIHSSGTGNSITTYGKFYPNIGVMVFDPAKLNTLLKFNTVTGSNIAGDNAMKLFTSISGSGNLGSFIKARNVKYKTTNHYFVRVSPPQSNYSNNPTFVSDTSTGKIANLCFQKEPVTYVTSVGLYSEKKELLAVAKLSKPVKKTPDDDLLIKIRLNW